MQAATISMGGRKQYFHCPPFPPHTQAEVEDLQAAVHVASGCVKNYFPTAQAQGTQAATGTDFPTLSIAEMDAFIHDLTSEVCIS